MKACAGTQAVIAKRVAEILALLEQNTAQPSHVE